MIPLSVVLRPSLGRWVWRVLAGISLVALLLTACERWQSWCAPPDAADPAAFSLGPRTRRPPDNSPAPAGMCWIPGGTCTIGSDQGADDEGPAHEVWLSGFWIDVQEVTVRQFAAFVAATGFETTAERTGRAWVFDPAQRAWQEVAGASWRKPDGQSSVGLKSDLPVVQVSWADAAAYARWAGKQLPTEAEWECAARGGFSDADYPWGRVWRPQGRYEANFWQGWFPDEDLAADGFAGPAPVKSFRANPYGLFDMAGNVWEWCADAYAADIYRYGPQENPTGPPAGDAHVVRGGSWLCAENSSRGLRVYGRECRPSDSAWQHLGFRCVRRSMSGR